MANSFYKGLIIGFCIVAEFYLSSIAHSLEVIASPVKTEVSSNG